MDDKWEYDNNLDPLDANDIYADPDGDHYENILEFRYEPNSTNPYDINDKPDYILVGPDDHNSIQEAVDIAVDGNIIVVKPGTYTDPEKEPNHTVIIKDKDITLRSINPLDPEIVTTTIITSSEYSSQKFGIQLDNSCSKISGFTITRRYWGINCCNNSSPEINRCVIYEHYQGGMTMEGSGSSTIKIENCTFSDNKKSSGRKRFKKSSLTSSSGKT